MLLYKDEIKYHKVPLNQFEILPKPKVKKVEIHHNFLCPLPDKAVSVVLTKAKWS